MIVGSGFTTSMYSEVLFTAENTDYNLKEDCPSVQETGDHSGKSSKDQDSEFCHILVSALLPANSLSAHAL